MSVQSSGGFQSLEKHQARLKALRRSGLFWRHIAELDAYRGIPPGTLSAIAKGREPKKKEHRAILGLSEIITIQVKRNEKGRFE